MLTFDTGKILARIFLFLQPVVFKQNYICNNNSTSTSQRKSALHFERKHTRRLRNKKKNVSETQTNKINGKINYVLCFCAFIIVKHTENEFSHRSLFNSPRYFILCLQFSDWRRKFCFLRNLKKLKKASSFEFYGFQTTKPLSILKVFF